MTERESLFPVGSRVRVIEPTSSYEGMVGITVPQANLHPTAGQWQNAVVLDLRGGVRGFNDNELETE